MTSNFLKKTKIPVIGHILEGRFLFLVVSLLAYFAIAPLLEDFIRIRLFVDIFLTAILVSGMHAVSTSNRERLIIALIALPLLVTLWLYRFVKIDFLPLTTQGLLILFLIYCIACILSFILKAPRVTRDVIYAAISVYLFIGLLWSGVYMVLESLQPGSFSFTKGQASAGSGDFNYYSFVTLTTLGYGDITPLTAKAKAFAMLEAVVGQLYLVVLVARLVGMHIAHSSKKNN